MTTHHGRSAALAALAAGLLVGGCSVEPDEYSNPAGSSPQACDDLAAYRESLQSLAQTIEPGATVDDLQQAREQTKEAQRAAHDSVSDVTDDRVDEVNRAWDALETAFGALPDDATLGEAAASLKDEVEGVAEATTGLVEDLDCT